MRHLRSWKLLCAVAVGASLSTAAMAGPAQISQGFGLVARVDVDVTAAQCDNRGNTIDIESTITLIPDVGLTLTFSNKIVNNNGYHPASVTGTGDITLTPAEGGIHLPKQGVYEDGVTGNPHIWALIEGQEIYLGRCVQGLRLNHLSIDVTSPAFIQAIISGLECSNRGSKIGVTSGADLQELDHQSAARGRGRGHRRIRSARGFPVRPQRNQERRPRARRQSSHLRAVQPRRGPPRDAVLPRPLQELEVTESDLSKSPEQCAPVLSRTLIVQSDIPQEARRTDRRAFVSSGAARARDHRDKRGALPLIHHVVPSRTGEGCRTSAKCIGSGSRS